MLSDVSYALRSFAKRPGFAASAVATLALGIGATSAIFSIVHAVLLRPLPYPEPERLVHIWEDLRNRDIHDFSWPPADFHDLWQHVGEFADVAALTTGRQGMVGRGGQAEAELVRMAGSTPNLFTLLGARVILGRDFEDADAVPPPAQDAGASPATRPPPRTIVSHEFYQRRFGGNPGILNAVVRLGDQPFEIIGVLEPGFALWFPAGTNVERVPDVWTPLRIDFAAGSRIDAFLRVIGRLKPGVSRADAQRQLDNLAAQLRARDPIKETAGLQLRLERMDEDLVADVRTSILALMAGVVFLLLIACANVGNLLLARTAAREREFAVRSALGGTRWRLVRQLLAESVMLALLGAAFGIMLAWLGISLLLSLGPEVLPRLNHVTMDPTVVGFGVTTGLVSAGVFGLIPALRASGADVVRVLRKASLTSPGSAGGWLRSGVVTLEVALCFVLLVGSGLMARTLIALQRGQHGYDPRNVLTFRIPDLRQPDPLARQAFMADLKRRLNALPGVVDVTAASPLPLDGRSGLARWGTEDALSDPTQYRQATTYFVMPGYFEAMRTRVLEGRTFAETDNSPNARVVLIDRVLAAKAFPGRPAVGRTLLLRLRAEEAQRFQIIGVVDHQRHASLATDGREGIYVPDGYGTFGAADRWAVRTTGTPGALVSQIRVVVSALNPRAGVVEFQPMDVMVAKAQAQTIFVLVLVGIFAAIAVALAAVGLYSVLSTSVRQRTAEIGIRMACGAEHGRIFRMLVVQGVRLSVAGIVAGMFASWALTRFMRTMLVGVEPTDPFTFAAVAAGIGVMAVVACGAPALRAARLDPMVALREG